MAKCSYPRTTFESEGGGYLVVFNFNERSKFLFILAYFERDSSSRERHKYTCLHFSTQRLPKNEKQPLLLGHEYVKIIRFLVASAIIMQGVMMDTPSDGEQIGPCNNFHHLAALPEMGAHKNLRF